MCVINDNDNRSLILEVAQQVEEPGSRGDVVLGRGCLQRLRGGRGRLIQPSDAHELIDDPVGQQGFGLLPAGPKDEHAYAVPHEPVHQRGLADSRWALDKDNARMSRSGFVELGAKQGELGLPADEVSLQCLPLGSPSGRRSHRAPVPASTLTS